MLKLSEFENTTEGLSIVVLEKLSSMLFSPSSFEIAYLESIASFIPRAEIWINCLRLYFLHSFAKIVGKTV